MSKRGSVLACLALVAGCATTTVHQLNPAPGYIHPRPASEVEIFSTTRPTYPYVEVSLIVAREDATADALDVLRAEAGERGCDGVILVGAADSSVGRYGGVRLGYRGTCIMRTDGGPEGDPRRDANAPALKLEVSVGEAVVRSAPSDAAPVIASLPLGTNLGPADPAKGQWRRARLQDGRWGFVRVLEVRVLERAPVAAATPTVPLATAPAPAPAGCEPICSPGYGCQAGVCVPLCNPPCGDGDVCGGDRICRRR